ncbi:MAG: hypothetical protein ACREPF_00435 [Rhodanobacteraceae bacterium]
MDQSPPSSTGAPARTARSALARAAVTATACFGWLMCTLATGAVAAFAALVADIHPNWFVLVLAIPLTLVLKVCGCLRDRWAGPVAAAAVILAAFYAICLVAIARVAAATGFPFGEAFATGGVGLILQVGKLGLSAASLLVYAGAALLAALVATWLGSSSDHP